MRRHPGFIATPGRQGLRPGTSDQALAILLSISGVGQLQLRQPARQPR
jgi:hypothetical protein